MPHTQHHFPNTRDKNATTTFFPQRSPIERDTLPPRSSTSVRLRSFSPSPSSSGHSRSWSPRRRPVWGDRSLQSSTPAPSLNSRPQRLNPQSSICHIHRKYGDQAIHCAGNCNWRVINRNAFLNPNSPQISIITGETHPWIVRDPNTNIAFIIDTGSRDSIIPCQRLADDPRTSGYFSAANGSHIATYERVTLRVTLGLPAEFSWDFLKAATSHAIIGLDFLEHFQISLNPQRRLMTLPETHEKKSTISTTSTKLTEHEAIAELHRSIPTAQTVSSLENLFSYYPSVFEVDNFHCPTRHQTLHHIRTVGPPVCSKVRRLSPEKLDVLKSELQKLLNLGVIEQTESPYASPVHLVPKKNPVEFRITGDFRLLNEQTIADKCSISLLTDFIGMLAGSTVFTTLDLYKSYHQIRIAPEDVHKTAMITPFGNYAFKRLAMGLKSAGSIFCRFMREVLRGVPNCFVYIDDILIFSESEEGHWKHLSEVFNRLEHFGLILNKDKN